MARILLVEDNDLNRDMLARRLLRRGYTVVPAQDGEQAIHLATGQPPDVVILDLHLPGLPGLAVLWRLRGTARGGPDTDYWGEPNIIVTRGNVT